MKINPQLDIPETLSLREPLVYELDDPQNFPKPNYFTEVKVATEDIKAELPQSGKTRVGLLPPGVKPKVENLMFFAGTILLFNNVEEADEWLELHTHNFSHINFTKVDVNLYI